MVIEFVGMVGAGKTELCGRLQRHLRSVGVEAMSLDEATRRCADRAAGIRVLPVRSWRTIAARTLGMLTFLVTCPRAVMQAVRSQIDAPITLSHRRIILSLFFGVAGKVTFVRRRLQPNEVVLVDEGLVHRAVNLFAWAHHVDRDAVRSYLETLPQDGVVVEVAAGAAVATARVEQRGYPKRLRGADDATVDRFMASVEEVATIAHDYLDTGSRPWIEIRNEDSADTAVATLVDRLDTIGTEIVASPMRATPLPRVRVRRPDRIPMPVGRTSGLAASEVAAVLDRYGSRLLTTRRFSARGGRSDTGVVLTDAGLRFVKRYKPGLSTAAVDHEHEVLTHLANAEFPAPRLVAATDGATRVVHDGRQYAVFELISGGFHYHEYLWPPGRISTFTRLGGEALGELHYALGDFRGTYTNPDGISPDDGGRHHDAAWARRIVASLDGDVLATAANGQRTAMGIGHRLVERLATLEAVLTEGNLTRGTIHGDYGPYNMLFGRDGRITILDFELSRYDWWITDVAKALGYFGANRLGFQIDRMRAFLDGYQSAARLNGDELRLIPAIWEYLALRRAVVCSERFAGDGDTRWVEEARSKLKLAATVADATDTLATLHTGS